MRALFHEPSLRPSTGYHQIVIENALQAAPLFHGISPAQLARLVAIACVKPLAAGETLFAEGEPSAGLYIVQSGAIRLFRINARGDEQVVHIARPGESFAEETLFAHAGHTLHASAVKNTRLVVLPRVEFMHLLKTCPDLLMRLTAALSSHLCETISLLGDLRLKSARVRLGHWLLHQCSNCRSAEPQTILFSMPKKDVASELGMASETFSRVLAQLQGERLIVVRGRTVILPSPRQLEASVSQEENEASLSPAAQPCYRWQ